MSVFIPIYEKDDNKFFVIASQFVGKDRDEAMNIGWGSMLVECILLGMKFTNEIMEVDPDNLPHVKAGLGPYQIGVVEGPMFQEAVSA